MTKSLNFWLVNILLSAFFFACKDKGETGVVLQAGESVLNSVLIDTFTVKFSTVFEKENIATNGTRVLLAGAYHDDELGDISSSAYFQLVPSEEYELGEVPVCEGVRFHIGHFATEKDNVRFDHYYGDITAPLNLEVFQLTGAIENKTYTTTDIIAHNPIAEGSTGLIYHFPESAKTLAIDMKSSYGQSVLDNYTNDQTAFLEKMKGLLLKSPDGNLASILSFSVKKKEDEASDDTFIEITYHNQAAPTEQKRIFLTISEASRRFNHTSIDLSSTALSALTTEGSIVPSTTTTNKTYIQSGSGVRTLIEIPHFKAFLKRKENEDLLIAKVELILPIDKLSTTKHFSNQPPAQIAIYEASANNLIKRDGNGNAILVANEESSGLIDYASYDEEKQQYTINLGLHTQNYVRNKTDDFNLIISALHEANTVNKAVLFDTENTSGKATFKLYYTKKGK